MGRVSPLAVTPNGIQYDILNSTGTPCEPPEEAFKISLSTYTPNTFIYTDTTSLPVIVSPKPHPNILQTDSAILRLLGPEILQMGDQKLLAASLAEGTLQGASNGSMKFGQGTCAWRIEPRMSNVLSDHSITGAAPVDGDPDTMNSTRSERGGFHRPPLLRSKIGKQIWVKTGQAHNACGQHRFLHKLRPPPVRGKVHYDTLQTTTI